MFLCFSTRDVYLKTSLRRKSQQTFIELRGELVIFGGSSLLNFEPRPAHFKKLKTYTAGHQPTSKHLTRQAWRLVCRSSLCYTGRVLHPHSEYDSRIFENSPSYPPLPAILHYIYKEERSERLDVVCNFVIGWHSHMITDMHCVDTDLLLLNPSTSSFIPTRRSLTPFQTHCSPDTFWMHRGMNPEPLELKTTKYQNALAKPTTIKDALKRWEEKHKTNPAEATEVIISFQWPPIEKMDSMLGGLIKCEKLSLSTNMIEKISGISLLKNLKVLSLGRNYIKTFSGLEAIGETLEELWLSYNLIEKIKGVGVLKKLKVLYLSNNIVKDWPEFNKLQEIPNLEDLVFVGNPLSESYDENMWRAEAIKRLPNLKKLDGEPVIREETPTEIKSD
uniref:Dynein axonemal light chain 1 n=2 Tax=Timema TaxID=61471 RepID=A0A7R9HAY2_TIMPO|nr:unnamed protein product [Timema poppensis]